LPLKGEAKQNSKIELFFWKVIAGKHCYGHYITFAFPVLLC